MVEKKSILKVKVGNSLTQHVLGSPLGKGGGSRIKGDRRDEVSGFGWHGSGRRRVKWRAISFP